MKDQGFLGMIIPKKYGGLEFSALAHSAVVMKLATRSNAAAVSVMVPNSLGPAELLLHYGTEEQKDHYLPRLARGLEIPCFALTSPEAGSDAAAIPDFGVVCRGMHQGKEVLGMRVTWDKRYITLGPVATLLGLAFRLYDPERLLGGERGPRHHLRAGADQPPRGRDRPPAPAAERGVPERAELGQGRVHAARLDHRRARVRGQGLDDADGLPRRGPLDFAADLFGRAERRRWRAIPAPTPGCAASSRPRSASSRASRRRSAGSAANCYLMDATRVMTAGAVDAGEKPAVISAIAKYHMTERVRKVIDDAMDIHGGKGICLGPNNWIGRGYQVVPIGITVEGANILTRSLIIFGQGAIRCHPYVLREMRAAKELRGAEASREFDAALFAHIGHTLGNGARAFCARADGLGVRAGAGRGRARDEALLQGFDAHLGGLRLRGRCLDAGAGRLAQEEGEDLRAPRRRAVGDVPRLGRAQALRGPGPSARGPAAARILGPGRALPGAAGARRDHRELPQPPRGAQAAARSCSRSASASRRRRTVSTTSARSCCSRRARRATASPRACTSPAPRRTRRPASRRPCSPTIACEPIERKLRDAVKRGAIAPRAGDDAAALARDKGVISAEEYAQWQRKEALRRDVIKVDDFEQDFGRAEIMQQAGAGAGAGEGGLTMTAKPVYIVDGARTPFLKAQNRPGPLRRQRPRHPGGARAAAAPEVRAHRAGRGDPRLRRALGRRGQHRPRRRAAHGLRAEGARRGP